MAADVLIREARADDAAPLAADLRACDREESAAYGFPFGTEAAIRLSIRNSLKCWTAFVDGDLACIFGVGVVSLLGGEGAPWMMGTGALDRHSRILQRLSPTYIAEMLKLFPYLHNHVHVGNRPSIRWLRRLGFTIHPPEPFGARGEMFHPFDMRV